MSMICCLREISDSEIQNLLDNPEQVPDLLEEEKDEIDLDKSWHGIHFLLTGSAWEGDEPLCYLITGGQEIGDEMGYGPARALTSKQVADFDTALSAITADDMRRRFDPQAMAKAQIYPDVWVRPDEEDEDNLDYLIEYFEQLKSFVGKTREQGKGMIIYLT